VNHRRRWALAPLLLAVVVGLGGCYKDPPAADPPPPAQLKAIPGTTLHYVTLTPRALADVGVRLTAVRDAAAAVRAELPRAGSRALTVIPLQAVIYDPQGRAWTYTTAGPRTFVRKPIAIALIVGDEAVLRSGPPPGTPVVTVGAPELLGAEYGVGEE
jgi:hypothetical protein